MKLDFSKINEKTAIHCDTEDKPRAEYTIAEWHKHCRKTECNMDCLFWDMCDKLQKNKTICDIDLYPKPRFTSDDMEKLKAIKLLYPTAYAIEKTVNSGITLHFKGENSTFKNQTPTFKIESIKQGETINIDDVLKEYGI